MARREAVYTINGECYRVRQFDGARGSSLFFRLGRAAAQALRSNFSGLSEADFEAIRDAVLAESWHLMRAGDRTVPVELSSIWTEHFEGDRQGDLFVLIGHALRLNYERFFRDTLWPALERRLSEAGALASVFQRASIGSPGAYASAETAASTP